jgi:hypothetical protein
MIQLIVVLMFLSVCVTFCISIASVIGGAADLSERVISMEGTDWRLRVMKPIEFIAEFPRWPQQADVEYLITEPGFAKLPPQEQLRFMIDLEIPHDSWPDEMLEEFASGRKKRKQKGI